METECVALLLFGECMCSPIVYGECMCSSILCGECMCCPIVVSVENACVGQLFVENAYVAHSCMENACDSGPDLSTVRGGIPNCGRGTWAGHRRREAFS